MSDYRVKIRSEVRQEIKDVSTGALLYLDTGGNWVGIPLGDWQAMEHALRRLTAEEFWEGLRRAVPDLDEPFDELGISPDVLDFYHSRGITQITGIPWKLLMEALIICLHDIWLTDAIKPKEEQFISILVAMARNILEKKEGLDAV